MSWQAYVDDSLLATGVIKHGAILGASDGQIWAKDETFQLVPAETKTISSGFHDPSTLYSSGIRIAGDKYAVLRATEEHIHGKKGATGVIASRSKSTIVLACYDDTVKPEPVNTVVEALSDYLRQNGF